MLQLRHFLLGLALSATASAQTLDWQIESNHYITSPGVDIVRPAALEPHLSGWPVFCEIYYDMNLEYDLTVTNLTNAPKTVFLGANVVPGVIRGGLATGGGCTDCWATTDPSGLMPLSIDPVTLAANETLTVTGTAPWPNSYPMWRQMMYCTIFHPCADDSVHGSSIQMAYSPSGGAPTWHDSSEATIHDNGSYSYIDLRFRTRYDLPPIVGPNSCIPANTNSTGQVGALHAYGVPDVDTGLVVLSSTNLPMGQFGYYLVSTHATDATPMGNGLGTLCLGGSIYRWHDSFALIDADGIVNQEITPNNMPVPGGGLIGPSIWHFQFWHRDQSAGGSTSNTTNEVSIAFN